MMRITINLCRWRHVTKPSSMFASAVSRRKGSWRIGSSRYRLMSSADVNARRENRLAPPSNRAAHSESSTALCIPRGSVPSRPVTMPGPRLGARCYFAVLPVHDPACAPLLPDTLCKTRTRLTRGMASVPAMQRHGRGGSLTLRKFRVAPDVPR